MVAENKKRMWFCSDYGIENKYIIKRLNENEELANVQKKTSLYTE